jgi:hypothetical protein
MLPSLIVVGPLFRISTSKVIVERPKLCIVTGVGGYEREREGEREGGEGVCECVCVCVCEGRECVSVC